MIPMRYSIAFLLVFTSAFLFLKEARAQQNYQPDSEFVAPKKAKRTLQKKTEQEPLLEWSGSLVKAIQSSQPWQMVSPFAPASYGTGEKMTSEDPDELGHPRGLVLFGIQW